MAPRRKAKARTKLYYLVKGIPKFGFRSDKPIDVLTAQHLATIANAMTEASSYTHENFQLSRYTVSARLAEIFAIAAGQGLARHIEQTGIAKFWEDVSQIVFWTKDKVPGTLVQVIANYLVKGRLRFLEENEDIVMVDAQRPLSTTALAIDGYIERMKDLDLSHYLPTTTPPVTFTIALHPAVKRKVDDADDDDQIPATKYPATQKLDRKPVNAEDVNKLGQHLQQTTFKEEEDEEEL
ncbi:hypothetical protein CONLIGDRAFT_675279 [Coniochaeta ligniaria NRRL 30616]|uniref:Uncharacterized protein n=1 Tax=Coniochaeta ligniaria NRRL 30616 TaxID=1408157 RepID=A0A1J7K2A1_9PEZI|nr:hypothetical protein CONLIGDRAFT_675279 [Coniochaeta ligniaria NRRL 30616]